MLRNRFNLLTYHHVIDRCEKDPEIGEIVIRSCGNLVNPQPRTTDLLSIEQSEPKWAVILYKKDGSLGDMFILNGNGYFTIKSTPHKTSNPFFTAWSNMIKRETL